MPEIVKLKPPAGTVAPSEILLPDNRRVHPDADGCVTVWGAAAIALVRAGWQVVAAVK